MKNLNFSLFYIASMFFVLLSACSSNLDVYTNEPMEKARLETPIKVNFDILLKNTDGTPVRNTVITLKSSTFIDSGTTDNNGVVTLAGERSGSETLEFNFENDKIKVSELLGHLPTSFTNGVLSFELLNTNRARLSHYVVDGLHR